jgi:hypothetical protein
MRGAFPFYGLIYLVTLSVANGLYIWNHYIFIFAPNDKERKEKF